MEEQKVIAEAGKRLGAYLIDMLPILGLVIAIFYFFFGFDVILDTYMAERTTASRIDFLIQRNYIRNITLIVLIIYSIFMECSEKQATLGKQLLGIIVVNSEGQRMSFDESLKRNASKVLSGLILGLGFIWILISNKKQGWHDLIAKTFVVDKPKYTKVIISSRRS